MGEKRQYLIRVKKGRGKKTPFSYYVETPTGKSSTRRTADCSDIVARGHMIGGTMVGATKAAQAAGNPAKLQRLEREARRGLAKKNPRQRIEAEVEDIPEMRGIFGLPSDPEEAFRYGYRIGIIKGIDTCGVQNYMKRRRIKKAYIDRIAEGEQELAARLSGTKLPRQRATLAERTRQKISGWRESEDDEPDMEMDAIDEYEEYVDEE